MNIPISIVTIIVSENIKVVNYTIDRLDYYYDGKIPLSNKVNISRGFQLKSSSDAS